MMNGKEIAELNAETLGKLKALLEAPKKITVVSHANPDGDAIGSGLGWTRFLEKLGHEVMFVVPNYFPSFLNWMEGIEKVRIFKRDAEAVTPFIAASELVCCLDLNDVKRLEGLSDIIFHSPTPRVLIDHHLSPPDDYALSFSNTTASSTAYLVYKVIEGMGLETEVDRAVAESLLVGITTDTGNFAFGNLTPDLFRVVGSLVDQGVDLPRMNMAVYNNFSENRMRLMGYALDRKMETVPGCDAACIWLDQAELKRYKFEPGDTEGFVNLPLAIGRIGMSALFVETLDCIKVSLRSQGEIDVNLFARKHFNGGGHKNASGGKFFGPMDEALATFRAAVTTEFSA
ncbi:MAG: DHH family phosphoesterase [Rikenellaceae bacterium]|nr:DHH family phosphoesterase [Rikenellaceae bacterium]